MYSHLASIKTSNQLKSFHTEEYLLKADQEIPTLQVYKCHYHILNNFTLDPILNWNKCTLSHSTFLDKF
jgi:hypothetical protein